MTERRSNQIRMSGAILALASGLLYLLLPVLALGWASNPFAGFLLDPNLVVSDTGMDGWARTQLEPRLTYPERLVAVDGVPVADNAAFYALLAQRNVGESVTLTLQQPQDSVVAAKEQAPPQRTVTITLTQFGIEDLWTQFWLPYLVGLVLLIIGGWTFWVRPQAEATQFFVVFTTLGAWAMGGLFDLVTTQRFVRVWITAVSLATSLNISLAFVFPHEARLLRKRPYLKWLVLLPGLAVMVWGQLWLARTADPWAYALPWRAAFILSGVTLLLAWAVMAQRAFRSPSPLLRQQVRLILLGAVLAFIPLLIFFLKATFFPTAEIPWIVPEFYLPPVIVYPLAIGYVIIRFRLLDVDVVRQGVTYLVLAVLLLAALALAVTSLNTIVPVSSPILLAILALLAALVFEPLRHRVQEGVDQLFFREPATLDDLLRGG